MTLPAAATLEFLLTERLAPWLLTYGVHSSLLLLVALVAARWMSSASARERMWKFAMLGPLLTASLQLGASTDVMREINAQPEGPVGAYLPSTVESPGPAVVPVGVPSGGGTLKAEALPSETRLSTSSVAAPPSTWPLVLTGAWMVMAMLAGLHFFHVRRRLVKQLGHRERLQSGALFETLERLVRGVRMAGRVRLTESAQLSSPVAIGRREICVPARVREGLDGAEQESLLAHELAHLARRDPAWLIGAHLIERVLFFQPLLRLVRRRLSEEMELMADAWAVGHTEDPVRMARCLARVAEWVESDGKPQLAPGMASSPSQLVRRIESVLEPQDPKRARRSSRFVACLGVLSLGALAYAGPRVYGASAPPSPLELARWELDASWADLQEELSQDLLESEKTEANERGNPLWAAGGVPPQPGAPGSSEVGQDPIVEVPIRIGDVLRIYDTYRPEALNRTETVGGLGTVILPELGRVVVLGLNRTEFELLVRDAYAEYYDLIDLHVQHTPSSRRICMAGAVREPGTHELKEGVTLWEAVLAHRAKDGEPDLSRVRLIRPDPANPLVMTVDVTHILTTGDTTYNVLLHPGDIIFVPTKENTSEVNALAHEVRELQKKLDRYLKAREVHDKLADTAEERFLARVKRERARHSDATGPRLDIELDLSKRPSADGAVQVVTYNLRWELDKPYSASARFEADSLEAILPVLDDLSWRKADYVVVITNLHRGMRRHDIEAVWNAVNERGFESVRTGSDEEHY